MVTSGSIALILQGILGFQLHIIRLSLEAVDFPDISIILDIWKATAQ